MLGMRWTVLLAILALSTSVSAKQTYIRVAADQAQSLKSQSLNAGFQHDYGNFLYLQVSDNALEQLQSQGIAFSEVDARDISFLNWQFDPLSKPPAVLNQGAPVDANGRGLVMVQFHGPSMDDWLSQITALGFDLIQYYPHHGFLAYGDPSTLEATRSLGFVRWAGEFVPAFKFSPQLERRQGVISNVYVHFFNSGSPESIVSRIEALGGEIINSFPAQPDRRLYDAIVRLDASRLDALSQFPEVIWMGFADPNPILDDESSSQTVAGNFMGSGQPELNYFGWLSDVGLDGTGVIWAITDTGVDYTHPDLNTRIVGGQNYPGCTPTNPGDDPAGGGHGTHVAGIVGADATGGFTDGDGYLYGLGVAPNYSIFAQNPICGSQSSWPPAGGWQVLSRNAVLGGAIGTNNSWTSGEGTAHGYQATERTMDLMVRDGDFDTASVAEPFMIVFSAGNSGSGPMTLTSPKEAKNVVVTAGTQTWRVSGDVDQMYNSSSRGPAVDGRFVPTIAAPGQSVASTRNDDGGSCGTAIGGTNNLYSFCTGTSMASPHAAGSLVLISEWWRDANSGDDPSPAMGKALLINTATDIQDTDAPAIPNFDEGWGRVTLRPLFQPVVPFEFFDQEETLGATGEMWQISVGVVDTNEPLKVSLVWSDAPGAVGANPALVNDLDLTVETGGNTFLGNVFSGGASMTGGSADTLNNAENVFVTNPGGSATVTVSATNISGDGIPYNGDMTDQDFALVCQNCALQADFTVNVAPGSVDVCAPDDAMYDIDIGTILTFNDPVTMVVTGNPAGTTPAFSPGNMVTPPAMVDLTLSGTGSVAAGNYPFTLESTSTTGTKMSSLELNVFDAAPGQPALMTPADDQTNVDPATSFAWSASSQVSQYLLEVDDDPAFGSPEVSELVSGENFTLNTPLATNVEYFWRVTAGNACNDTISQIFSFVTSPAPGDCTFGVSPITLLFDDMESGAPGWTHSGTQDTWQLSGDNVFSGSFAWYGEDLDSISDQRLVSPTVQLPMGQLPITLQFQQHQTIEDDNGTACWDAAILEVSTDGGSNWTQVPDSAMLTDPYDGIVNDFMSGPNPLANLEAWCGDPQDWTNAIVDLSAWEGEEVQFRYRLGTDGTVGRAPGWKIDDVRVQSCPASDDIFNDNFETNM